jgi:hypothetical protein
MGWTADTNFNLVGAKSILQIRCDQSAGAQANRLPSGIELSIRHPDRHITNARIAMTRTGAEIQPPDRTKWHMTPFDPSLDLPTLNRPGRDVQVWVVRKQIA